jgi:hypothetical protein
MPRQKTKQEHLGSIAVRRAFFITEVMNFPEREARELSGNARGSAPTPPLSYQETGPEDLRRWRKPEKPIETIS